MLLINARCVAVIASVLILTGCMPAAITAAGLGGSAAMSHTLNGITYRTFTEPSPRVKTATFAALTKMGIKVISAGKYEGTKTDLVRARANDRDIEIRLEPLSENATRMRVTAKNGAIFYDSATSTEIILQTERVLAHT